MTSDSQPSSRRRIYPGAPGQQETRLRTARGVLTIGADGQLHGLWRIVKRELLTNEQVRQLTGARQRVTLTRWRAGRDFPAPVLTYHAGTPRVLELWSRSDVEAWLAANPRRKSESEDF